jgi:uncharacterized protein (TIGR02145 family)
MNMLLDIVKKIVAENGEQILFDPKRVNAFFGDLAKGEPKPIKRAFIECLEHGVVKILKDVAKEERAGCKETIAQKLRAEEGSDTELYRQVIDILCEVLFGCVPSPTTTFVNIPKTSTNGEDSYFKDPRDGTVYRTVKIGNQVWMAENLNYKIGDSWCYDNNEANGKKYGRLYTWDAAKAACPRGWRLPTRQEWDKLVATAGGCLVGGNKLKSKSGWLLNGNGSDEFGVSALPGGYRGPDGGFSGIGTCGDWWAVTEFANGIADSLQIYYYTEKDNVFACHTPKNNGFSVRCVGDGASSSTQTSLSVPKNTTAVLTVSQNDGSSFKDPRDGNVYKTVKIGNQVWMAENLNYKIDGSCCYDNNDANGNKYGRLYAWDAAKIACPKGWHLPSRQEWDDLLDAAGGERVAAKKLKARYGWNEFVSQFKGTNDFGFSALPGGFRHSGGNFLNAGDYGYWWVATEGGASYDTYNRQMDYASDKVCENPGWGNGYSVRCVKDGASSSTKTILSVPKNTTAVLTVSQNDELSFKDPRDGNVYRTVKIGNQVWMAENLNYKINNSWCYNNNEANGKKYGRLYTWDVAKVACPMGWHLPSRQEWDDLVAVAGGKKVAGKKLKARCGWDNLKDGSSGNGTDDYSFSVLPGGTRNPSGDFYNAGYFGGWWTATEYGSGNAYHRYMFYDNDGVVEGSYYRSGGQSVRCVKNDDEITFECANVQDINDELLDE